MNPLDNRSILALSKILKQGTHPSTLFAIEYEDSIVVTNRAWLMEWPKQLVDTSCPRLEKLFSNCRREADAKGSITRLLDNHWKDALLHQAGKYVSVEEDEPAVVGHEEENDSILIRYRDEIIPYNWVNFEATELFIPDADYRMYKPPKEQNMARIMKLLVTYNDSEHAVGLFTNNRP